MTEKSPQPLGGTAIKPAGWDKTGWEAVKDILYDPTTGAVLTRTPFSWFKITIFYIIYYTFLTGFWIACLVIFFQTLPYPIDGPRWTQDHGLIGANPGVGLRPRNTDARIDSQMFVLKDNDSSIYMSERKGEGDLNADYAERVNQFFKAYDKTPALPDTHPESNFKGYEKFDLKTLKFCGKFPYGYVAQNVTPCIYFKLNNIWGWQPKPIKCGNPKEILEADGKPYDECPDSLVKHMTENADAKTAGENNIWIDCNGRNPADQEAIADGIEYFPRSQAIPMSYFPYLGPHNFGNEKIGYHSPLVAAKITPSAKVKGQLIHIECRAYFRGVEHSKKHKMGLVQFEVQIV